MANENLDWALKFVFEAEGGYVNNPEDPGGKTNLGITQATYTKWRQAMKGGTYMDVRHITKDEATEIYRTRYWQPSGCDDLPKRLALCVFDCAVNSGTARAKSFLEDSRHEQNDAGVEVQLDLTKDEEEVCLNYLDDRSAFFHALVSRHPRQRVFLRGWMRRVNNLAVYAGLPWP